MSWCVPPAQTSRAAGKETWEQALGAERETIRNNLTFPRRTQKHLRETTDQGRPHGLNRRCRAHGQTEGALTSSRCGRECAGPSEEVQRSPVTVRSCGQWHRDQGLQLLPSPDKLDANLAAEGVGETRRGRAHLGMKTEKHLIDREHEFTRINFPLLRGTRPQDKH